MTNAGSARVTFEQDVVFGSGGGRDLKLDIYVPPEGTANRAGVLLIHGGGWSGGDRTQLRGFGILLGRVGYTCVSTEYRLSGEAKWPAQIHDVKAALRWMRANSARLGIDPEKIAVSGNSAGGHLSLMVAATANKPEFEGNGGTPGVSTDVAASVAIYPPTSMMRRRDEQGVAGAVGALMGPEAGDADYKGANPLTYAGAGFPPTMLLHGNKDMTVPVSDSFKMYEALTAAGATAEMHIFAGQPHAFDAAPDYGRECASLIDLFLKRHVLGIVPVGAREAVAASGGGRTP
jgi:acetyl esterase/lipase